MFIKNTSVRNGRKLLQIYPSSYCCQVVFVEGVAELASSSEVLSLFGINR